jgi:hypothetical protein
MTLSTDDLRRVLADTAADSPYVPAGRRLDGVRTRVRARRRRRLAAGALVVTAAVGGFAATAGLAPRTDRTAPAPAVPVPTAPVRPAPAVRAADTELPPFFHALRLVSGIGTSPSDPVETLDVPWDPSARSVLVRCAPGGSIELRLGTGEVRTDAPRDLLLPCNGGYEPQVSALPRSLLRGGRGSAPFSVVATAVDGAQGRPFSVGLMSGDQAVDLNPVDRTRDGLRFRYGFAFEDGQLTTTGTAPGVRAVAPGLRRTAVITLPRATTRARLLVRCLGAGRLRVQLDQGPAGPVICPADREVRRTLDLPGVAGGSGVGLAVDGAALGSMLVVELLAR